MFVSVSADISRAIEKLGNINKIVKEKAAAAAINKTAAKGRSEMTRQITAEYNIKARDVRAQLSINPASFKNGKIEATLTAFGKRRGHRSRNVILFDARQVAGNGPPKKVNVKFPGGQWRTIIVREGGGVSIKIKRTGGRKLIKGAFIGNKGRTVFIRTGDGRGIKAVETIDVPQMFNTKSINRAVLDRITQEFPVEMRRALALYLRR